MRVHMLQLLSLTYIDMGLTMWKLLLILYRKLDNNLLLNAL